MLTNGNLNAGIVENVERGLGNEAGAAIVKPDMLVGEGQQLVVAFFASFLFFSFL